MTHRTRRVSSLVALALVATAAAEVEAAPADATTIHLNLEAKGPPPTHVCVVTEGSDPRLVPGQTQPLKNLTRLLCRGGQRECGDPTAAWQEPLYFSVEKATEGESSLAASTAGGLGPDTEFLQSLHGLSHQHNEHQCTYSPTMGCLPTFSLGGINPEQAHVTCARNQAIPQGDERLLSGRGLVLGLSANLDAPLNRVRIGEMRLSGKHLLIRTSHDLNSADLVVRSLGGFYTPEPEARFTRGKSEADLVIEPRCRWTRVAIPPITPRERDPAGPANGDHELWLEETNEKTRRLQREQRVHDQKAHGRAHPDLHLAVGDRPGSSASVDKCLIGSLQGAELQLLIPYAPRGTKVLTINSRDKEPGEERPLWELEASWLDARPLADQYSDPPRSEPQRVTMSVRSLSFSWRADECLYPQGKCPDAAVSTSGLACTTLHPNVKEGLCHYRCAQEGAYVDFPTEIAFSRGADPPTEGSTPRSPAEKVAPYLRWSVRIRTIDQQLDGYVQPIERTFTIDTREWRAPPEWRDSFPCDLYEGRARRRRCQEAMRQAEERRSDETAKTLAEAAHARAEYARDERRELRAAICPAWPRRDAIYAIEFSTGGNERQQVEIDDVLRCDLDDDDPLVTDNTSAVTAVVKLPRVSCHEPITYRYIGERKYHGSTKPVENGAVRLPHPMSTARYLHFSLTLLPASFQWIVSPSALSRRHSSLLYAPLVEASLVVRPRRPAARGWRFNLDTTFMGAERPFLAVGTTTDQPDPRPAKNLYARWYLGFSFVTPWLGGRHIKHYVGPALAFGAGAQVGIGYSFSNRDLQRFGGVDWGLVAVRSDLRVRVWRGLEALFSPRLLAVDRVLRYTTDYHGQPDAARSRGMVSLLLPLGVSYTW